MMKPFIISLIVLCCFIDVQAQRLRVGASAGMKVTRNYDNVTMSEALRDLNELSPDYTISFMYNELSLVSILYEYRRRERVLCLLSVFKSQTLATKAILSTKRASPLPTPMFTCFLHQTLDELSVVV